MRDVVRAARDAGAAFLWANVLYLKPGTREHFLENLARDWPAMLDRYLRLYERPYAPRAESETILERFRRVRAEHSLAERGFGRPQPALQFEQLALFGLGEAWPGAAATAGPGGPRT
jgi:hypothetical protein